MIKAGTCIHFNGIQHDCCEAGINYDSVGDTSQPGPFRWPCHTHPGRERVEGCARFQEPTPEQIAIADAELQAAIAESDARWYRGECPDCGVKVTSLSQDGRCVYAAPCGHRVCQGEVGEVAKSMGVVRDVPSRRPTAG